MFSLLHSTLDYYKYITSSAGLVPTEAGNLDGGGADGNRDTDGEVGDDCLIVDVSVVRARRSRSAGKTVIG